MAKTLKSAGAAATAREVGKTESETVSGGSEITIDSSSGISEEEQLEILVQINGIAEKNRRSLSAGTETAKGAKRFKAKKNGGLFPVLVNILAIAALAGGFFALAAFQHEADIQAREGTRIFNTGERALIGEIRRETSALLAAKDMEINTILSSISDLETQMHELILGSEVLTLEQLAAQAELRIQQEERIAALAVARDERSRILDEARSREAVLQAQLEARTRELAAATEEAELQRQNVAYQLDAARYELARLSGEQAQAATVEAQMAAFFANIRRQTAENRIHEAEQTLAELREFVNSPAFHASRAIQPRRDLYLQAADALETLLAEYRTVYEAMQAGNLPADRDAEMRLQVEIARLESSLEERDNTINALGAGASGAAQHITQLQSSVSQLEGSVASLQSANTTLTSTNASLTSQVNTLQSSLATQTQEAETARQSATAFQTQITALNQTVNARDGAISELQAQNAAHQQTITALNEQLEGIRQALQALTQ